MKTTELLNKNDGLDMAIVSLDCKGAIAIRIFEASTIDDLNFERSNSASHKILLIFLDGEAQGRTQTMNVSEMLEPIAAWFRGLNVPEPIIHWGHPAMMAIVVLVLGSYVAWMGWRGRLAEDKEVAAKSWADHRKLAPLMTLFITLGYTGGVLSLVMQRKPILESPHFWTGNVVLVLLFLNGAIASVNFVGNKAGLRMFHAYIGTAAMGLLILHGIFGLKLGLSI